MSAVKQTNISLGKSKIITESDKCYSDFGGSQTFDKVACKFPFTYQGKEYHKCIKKDHNQYWCALDMNHFTGLNGLNLFCPRCWKNETYRWGNCLSGKSCGLGQQ